jgi:hypothetical protein
MEHNGGIKKMIEDSKKELIYYKEVDSGRLMQELYDVIPALKPIILNDCEFKVNLRVFTNGNKLTLWVLNETPEEMVSKIVNNHTSIIEKAGDE